MPQDQPRGSLASCRVEIKHRPRGSESRRLRASIGTDRASGRLGKEKESCLWLGSGVFTEDCGLMYMPSQIPRNWSEQGQGARCPP